MSLQPGYICEIRYDTTSVHYEWNGYQVRLVQYKGSKTWQVEALKIPAWLLTFMTKYARVTSSIDLPLINDRFIWDDVNALHPLKYESPKTAKSNPESYVSPFDGKLK